jgi:replicative DNA helicase
MQKNASTPPAGSPPLRWDLMKANSMSNAEAAVYYRSLGFAVVPVKFDTLGNLIPPRSGHRKFRWSIEEVRKHWEKHPDDGIALLLGVGDPGFNNIGVIDLDRHSRTSKDGGVESSSDGVAFFGELVPNWQDWIADAIVATTPRNGRHILVHSDSLRHSTGVPECRGIDRLASGLLFVAPTVRKGGCYQWYQNGVLKQAPPEVLALPYSKEATPAKDGNGPPFTLRDIDLDALPITESLKEAIRNCSGPEVERFACDRSAMVAHVAFRLYLEGISRDEALSILTQREFAISDKPLENKGGNRASAAEWVDRYEWAQAAQKIGAKRWQRFRELDSRSVRPARIEFPFEALPSVMQRFVKQVAEAIGTAPELVATPALAVLSALVATRFDIQPNGPETLWRARPLLWSLAIAPPGSGKTPSLNAILAPVRELQHAHLIAYKRALDLYKQAKAIAQAEASRRRRRKPDAPTDVEPSELLPTRLPPEPVCRRLTVGDTTVEALQKVLSENPGRVIVQHRDEISGLLTRLSDPRYAADRPFLMSCFDGSTAETIDRISRDGLYLKEPAVTVIGNVTPARVLSELASTGHDGLWQRFQLVCYPEPRLRAQVDSPEGAHIAEEWRALIRGLEGADAAGAPATCAEDVFSSPSTARQALSFDGTAQARFDAIKAGLREDAYACHEKEGLAGHLSKFPRFVASLAAVLHVAESGPGNPGAIGLTVLERAVALATYYRDQAERLYEAGEAPIRPARAALDVLPLLGSRFTVRELADKCAVLRDRETAERVLSYLVAHGHLREVGVIRTAGTGRNPSPTYAVHPVLVERYVLPQQDWAALDFADLGAPGAGANTVGPSHSRQTKPEPATVPIVQGGPAVPISQSLPGDPPAAESRSQTAPVLVTAAQKVPAWTRPRTPKPEPATIPIVQGGPAPDVTDVLPGDPRPADPGPSWAE